MHNRLVINRTKRNITNGAEVVLNKGLPCRKKPVGSKIFRHDNVESKFFMVGDVLMT